MSTEHPQASSSLRQSERFMRIAEVVQTTGFSRPHIYRLITRGAFPRAIPLGPRSVAWLQSDVDTWIREKIKAAA